MTEQETLAAMASHAFLRGLSERQLAALASYAKSVTIAAGEFLGREGEPASAFYLIHSGRVALEIHTPAGGPVRIQTVGAGEPVGWSWIVPPNRWQFDARAVESVQAFALDADRLREKCEQDHELGYQLLKRLVAVIANRLAATRLQLLDIYR
ncbi:MAG: cyclic nucleotide-binding domain-containing protein [Planctomycetes bacterium]|nr:cyclic nucleotide-binding domain-containing protein [Planctomycetota bacterium]